MENQGTSAKNWRRWHRNQVIVKSLWWALGGFFALMFILFVLIYNGVIGYMPTIEALRNPTDKFASTLYTADGKEMGKFYRSKGNRTYVDYEQMSKYLRDALIATEDVRFEEHSGVDVRALFRSLVKRIIMGQASAGGGSTITQQLAKQLYTPESSNLFQRALQKPIEWVIAIKLERYYTKEEIIKMYFNQFDFLNNAVGIKSAAWVYYGKQPKDLDVQESATLVGMCKNPSYFNPFRFPERVKQRRNVVLSQMYKAGMLTAEDMDALKKSDLNLHEHAVDTHEGGIAPYFREELRRIMMADEPVRSHYSNINAYNADKYNWDNNPLYGWCKKNKKIDGSNYDIYSDGLKIYTTIDSRMQRHAEDAVRQHMIEEQKRFLANECGGSYKNPYTRNPGELSARGREAVIKLGVRSSDRYRAMKAEGLTDQEIMSAFKQPREMRLFSYDGEVTRMMSPLDSMLYMKTFLRCGMMSMDPVTGKVKAYVGGPDFKHFKYDMVATGARQIGSTVKPFIYAMAMQNGLNPCSTDFENSQPVYGGWAPGGGSHGLGGHPQLRDALARSSNWIPPRILDKFTPDKEVEMMHNDFGITSDLKPNLTLSLGSCEISLYEMVSAYSAFANYGSRVLPMMVSQICDAHGNVIAEFYPKRNQAISPASAYRMVDMLRAVVTHGTATSHIAPYNLKGDVCGKTGTTNFNADAWFMGFTPELITGVWFGGEDRYIHFASTGEGQGAAAALPIFGLYMRAVYDDKSLPYSEDAAFNIPADFVMCPSRIGYDDETRHRHSSHHASGNSNAALEHEQRQQAQDQEAVNALLE